MTVQSSDPVVTSIAIRSGGFNPSVVDVPRGSTVSWTNEDDLVHTVSSAEMESGELAPGDRWSYTFERTGHFRYFCMRHPRNVGEVFVR